MKIVPLSNHYNTNHLTRKRSLFANDNKKEQSTLGLDKLMNYNISQINFQSNTIKLIKDINQTKLYPDFINSKKSLFQFIKTSKANPALIYEFLFGITKNEKFSKDFITEINAEPRKADEYTNILLNKIGSAENFKTWYYHQDGYQRAYERYFKKEVFENNDVSVGDMVKISPNIMIEALKLKSLKTTGTQDFIIGEVPNDIGTIQDFRTLTEKVRKSSLVKEFIKFRNFMEDLDAFAEKYPEAKKNAVNPARFAKDFLKTNITAYRNAESKEEKLKLEQKIPFLKYMKETTVQVGDKKYKYNPILRPYSTKLLFALEPEGTANKYFVTMEMFNDLKKTCKNVVDKENSAMRPDSPYLNAIYDYYLKQNGCENVPDMKFYDYASNAVVYPFIKGTSIKPEGRTDNLGVIFENTALKNELRPLAELNVFVTDCFYENFMLDATTGKTLMVDNGHAKYSNALKPGVKFIHMNFADLYGRDFVSLDASINRANQINQER